MKNPWMSMWLSAMNSAAGPARGYWTAEARRQQQSMTREWLKAMEAANPMLAKSGSSRKKKSR
jgi:hypothetical protein